MNIDELLGDLQFRLRSLTPAAGSILTSALSDDESDDDDEEVVCDGPVQWKRRFLDAFEPDEAGHRSRIALARELLAVDQEDTQVAKSGLYRRTIRDKDHELTTAVL